MSRIPYPDMSTVSEEKRRTIGYPEKPLLNVTRMALHTADGLWRAHYAFKQAAVYETTLDPWLREILILRVAYLSNSDYEIHHHLTISRNLGFTPEMQAALRDRRYETLEPVERALAEFTDEVVEKVRASDATFARLREHFGPPLILEILILIGSYMSTARVVANTGIALDDKPVEGWSDTAEAKAAQ